MTNVKRKPTMLMILDGYGINKDSYGNAILKAKKPNIDEIFSTHPYTKIQASGKYVGLPDGQMGNSEVGHLNMGAGRIVYQDLTMITKSIEDGDFFNNPALMKAINHVKENDGALHIFGLLSDGGVHSHIDHIKALIKLAKENQVNSVYYHAFMDGRDVPPTSGASYMEEIVDYMNDIGLGKVGIVSGRYYAMDRDKRWERLQLAYDALTLGKGRQDEDAVDAVNKAYDAGETDEFIMPTVVSNEGTILDGDSIIFANFRPDRAREITRAFVDPDFDNYGFKREFHPKDLCYVCMTTYDSEMPNVEVAFPPKDIKNTLGEYISSLGLKQLRIAETEKYAHVTFFFNGGVEEANENEDRILVPSPKVATYDLQPEMSAPEVKEKVIEQIKKNDYDLIILNFANSDMVGHTGVFDAAVDAIEVLDQLVKNIVDEIKATGGQMLITADHGNSDLMLDSFGNPVTAHSTNPVPLVIISPDDYKFTDYALSGQGKLADVAPTLLKMMGLTKPEEMTGIELI